MRPHRLVGLIGILLLCYGVLPRQDCSGSLLAEVLEDFVRSGPMFVDASGHGVAVYALPEIEAGDDRTLLLFQRGGLIHVLTSEEARAQADED